MDRYQVTRLKWNFRRLQKKARIYLVTRLSRKVDGLAFKLGGSQTLLIVAHADDEVIFAKNLVSKGRKGEFTLVIATFSGVRRYAITKICGLLYGFRVRCLFLRDDGRGFDLEDELLLSDFLLSANSNFARIVSHNLLGEYGHYQHMQLSQLVLCNVPLQKVQVFSRASCNERGGAELHLRIRLIRFLYSLCVARQHREEFRMHYKGAWGEPVSVGEWLKTAREDWSASLVF